MLVCHACLPFCPHVSANSLPQNLPLASFLMPPIAPPPSLQDHALATASSPVPLSPELNDQYMLMHALHELASLESVRMNHAEALTLLDTAWDSMRNPSKNPHQLECAVQNRVQVAQTIMYAQLFGPATWGIAEGILREVIQQYNLSTLNFEDREHVTSFELVATMFDLLEVALVRQVSPSAAALLAALHSRRYPVLSPYPLSSPHALPAICSRTILTIPPPPPHRLVPMPPPSCPLPFRPPCACFTCPPPPSCWHPMPPPPQGLMSVSVSVSTSSNKGARRFSCVECPG